MLPVATGPPFGITLLDLPTRIPLPAKITIEVPPPIDLEDGSARTPDTTGSTTITSAMQEVLSEHQDERTLPVLGYRAIPIAGSRISRNTLRAVKRIGFLSFGHWQVAPWSRARTARDALMQTIELAEAVEELGLDGAFVRVHHFARQLASPFPLLAAIGARTSRIEIGTAVIDMRYENPLYMAEDAAAADLISDGRLQLGISRGSPEPALHGAEAFGYVPPEHMTDADLAREKTVLFRAAIDGAGVAQADPTQTGMSGALPIQPQAPGLGERIWWGSGTRATAQWAAEQGMNLMSSTLLTEDTGVPFDELQFEQIAIFREAWSAAGWERESRISVSRSVIPIVSDEDRALFGGRSNEDRDTVGYLDGGLARFGRSYTGEPDVIAQQLASDVAVQAADTLLLTVPNQLGVEYNAQMLETIAREIAPAIGWSPAAPVPAERDPEAGLAAG